jgi:hypothetical protein
MKLLVSLLMRYVEHSLARVSVTFFAAAFHPPSIGAPAVAALQAGWTIITQA